MSQMDENRMPPSDGNPELVILRRFESIGVITLNRPDNLNAVNVDMAQQLGDALEHLQNDSTIHVGVITGSGRAFCAGMDLAEFSAGKPMPRGKDPDWGFAGIVNHPIDKPLIAAVNGAAVGGGLEIALACDLICVDEEAQLGIPEVRRGIFAAGGGVLRIAQQAPLRIGLELALTGRLFSASEALSWGLVNRVAPAGSVFDVAMEIASEITEAAPLSTRATKRLIYSTQHLSPMEQRAWELNELEMDSVFASQDAREGARAFVEKRNPQWSGT